MIRMSVIAGSMVTLAVLSMVASCGHVAGASWSASVPSASPDDSIPAVIIERATEFVVSRLGEHFFDGNVRFDPNHSQAHPSLPHYPVEFAERHPDLASRPCFRMVFDLAVREQPWAQSRIEFLVDSRGDTLPDVPVLGLPDCVHDPRECQFPIDEERAVDLAKAVGFQAGVTSWTVTFGWQQHDAPHHFPATFVWRISNTLSLSPTRDEGATIVIDANSGEVLWRGGWVRESISDGL